MTIVFVTTLSGLYMYGNITDPGMGPYPPAVKLALPTRISGFHTVLGWVSGFDGDGNAIFPWGVQRGREIGFFTYGVIWPIG